MSRRYPTAELYEERQRDFYGRNGNRSERSYDELDVDLRESSRRDDYGDPRRSQPEFLREDYGRTNAGPLTLRKSRTDDFEHASRASSARPARNDRDVERDEIIIRNDRRTSGRERDDRPPPPPSTRGGGDEREEIIFRERRSSRPPPPREVEKEEISYKRREDDLESRATSRRPPPPRDDDATSVRTNRTKATTRGRDVERDEIIIRREESRGPPPRGPPSQEEEREDIRFRRGNGPRSRPPPSHRSGVEKEEITFRHEERESGPPRPREVDREEITIRREERNSSPPRSVRSRAPPPPSTRGGGTDEREEIIFRHDEHSGPRGREHNDTLVIRPRERSLPPPRLVAREREDFVLRRREQRPPSPPSPPPPQVEKQEIIIRRTRSPSSSPSRSPSPPPPPPEPQPIMRPPIIQEIITHHRHIDHGVERARPITPPPPPPEPPKEDDFELSIRRRRTEGNRSFEEDIHIDIDREESRPPPKKEKRKAKSVRGDIETERIEIRDSKEDSSGDEKNFELSITRQRSQSAAAPRDRELARPRRNDYEDEIQAEADYYNRKATERGYPGEAYNGATKDWGLVDIPPGTRKVRMDGLGGAAQEISWQRYDGNRRSKFITDEGEFSSDFARGSQRSIASAPPKPKEDMWTEVTKDLVLEDAIKTMGYEYEETESFFYIMEYLRYEDVLQLVELSDDIRRDRRSRIKEIQWERDEMRGPPAPKSGYDEIIYEREVIHDHRGKRHR